MQIRPSLDAPLKFETLTTNDSVPAETMILITDGVQLTFEATDSADPKQLHSKIDLSADRVVIWTAQPADEQADSTATEGDAMTLDAAPRVQCFLEGNVTIRRADTITLTSRAMIDSGSKRPFILDGDLTTEQLVDESETRALFQRANTARAESRKIAGQTWGHCSATCKTDGDGKFIATTITPDYAIALTGLNIESTAFMRPVLGFAIDDLNQPPERTRDLGETRLIYSTA